MHKEGLKNECIFCGKCLAVCPLFQATDAEEYSPRAKASLIKALDEQGHGLSTSAVRSLAGLCLGCGRCSQVCPQQIDLPGLLQDLKASDPGWRGWIWKEFIEHASRLFPLLVLWGEKTPGLTPLRRGGMLKSLSKNGDLLDRIEVAGPKRVRNWGQAVLFPGCVARFAKTIWTQTATDLLRQAGLRPLPIPDWACCGFTLKQAGLDEQRLSLQTRNIDLWRELGRPRLIVFCATCLAGLRAYADSETGWEDEDERLDWLRSLTPLWHIVQDLPLAPGPSLSERRLLVHVPCHAPAGQAAWLAQVLSEHGARVGTKDQCCGLGGSMQLERPDLCDQVGRQFWSTVASKTDAVLTACSGCVVQLGAQAPNGIRVGHWLELFARALN